MHQQRRLARDYETTETSAEALDLYRDDPNSTPPFGLIPHHSSLFRQTLTIRRYEKWCQATLHLMAQPKEEIIGGTGRPYERSGADGGQAVVRLLVVLDDEEGGGIN